VKPVASKANAVLPSRAAPTKPTSSRAAKSDHKVLFQKYFKSIGPRTYGVQIKESNKGNHYIVLNENRRDITTSDVKKTRMFIYSEDFAHYFRMLHETAQFIKTHPVPEEIKLRRQRYWARKEAEAATAAREAAERQAAAASAKPIRPQKVAPPKTTTRKSGRR
jgi:hypothetical protein